MFPSSSPQAVTPDKPIQATLIFDMPPIVLEEPTPTIEETIPEPIVESEPLPAPVEIEQPPEPVIEKAIPKPEETVSVTEDIQQEQPPVEQPSEIPAPADVLTVPTVTPSPTDNVVTNMARRHLRNFQQQQRQKMAEQASRDYQQSKNSPLIDGEIKDPFMTEDEKLMESLKVRADCSNTAKKTTAMVLGFLGGGVECSPPPPIKGFIQKRLTKSHHLPAQATDIKPQSEVSLTQSVVVQDKH